MIRRTTLGLAVFLMITSIGLLVVDKNNNIIGENKAQIQKKNLQVLMPKIQLPIDTLIKEAEPKKEEIPIYDVPLSVELQRYLFRQCKENNIQYELMLSIIQKESNFNPDLINTNVDGSQDFGMCQVNECWIKDLKKMNITDLLNPYENIDAGIYIYSIAHKSYSNDNHRLMAYNMGTNKARKLINKGINSSEYSRGVIRYKNNFVEGR